MAVDVRSNTLHRTFSRHELVLRNREYNLCVYIKGAFRCGVIPLHCDSAVVLELPGVLNEATNAESSGRDRGVTRRRGQTGMIGRFRPDEFSITLTFTSQ